MKIRDDKTFDGDDVRGSNGGNGFMVATLVTIVTIALMLLKEMKTTVTIYFTYVLLPFLNKPALKVNNYVIFSKSKHS